MKIVRTYKFFHRFLRTLGFSRESSLPRIVTIRTFVPEGCRFEITIPVEAFRVEQYGNEEEFTRLILEELREKDVLYDIGACVGLVTVHAAKKCVHVVAFEPDPGYRSRLETNVRLNSLDNVQIIGWAVSDVQGMVTLFTDGVEGLSPSLREVGKRGSVRVRSDTIDNALGRGEIPVPDVLKMDIEGAEILALRGMRNLLASERAPRAFFLELHPDYLPAFDSCPAEVLSFLESFGYREVYKDVRDAQVHYIYQKRVRK